MLLTDARGFEDACRAARAAQRGWAAVPAPARGRVIAEVGRLFEANKEALARLVTREIGKPYPEALGEVQEIIDTCDFFLGEGRRLYGQTVPSEMPDKQLFTFRDAGRRGGDHHRRQLPGRGALLVPRAGDPVRQRGRVEAGGVQRGDRVGDDARSSTPAACPRACSTSCRPTAPQTFAGLERALEQRLVDKVGFTGSSAVGAEIGALCGRHLQSPCLELGGKNPMVVMDDADIDLAVEGALFGGFGTAGQRCTSLGTAIVHASVHDEFVRRLDERLRAAAIGDPMGDVLYGPMLHERFAERFEEWLGLIRPHHTPHGSTAQGRITADAPREGFVGDPEAGIFYHPTFVTGVTIEDDIYATETFGPLVGVARFDTFEEAMELANGHGYGLSVGDLHDVADARVPLPRADQRRDGVDQQLDVGRRGAPPVRRQRQVGQRLAPVGDLGARPVHALAVDELGLRREAPEGADGHRGDRGRARLPARRADVLGRRCRCR